MNHVSLIQLYFILQNMTVVQVWSNQTVRGLDSQNVFIQSQHVPVQEQHNNSHLPHLQEVFFCIITSLFLQTSNQRSYIFISLQEGKDPAVALCARHERIRGNEDRAPLIFNLGVRWSEWSVSLLRRLISGWRAPGKHRVCGWVGPTARFWRYGTRTSRFFCCPTSNLIRTKLCRHVLIASRLNRRIGDQWKHESAGVIST
jgi:hypothetical protein